MVSALKSIAEALIHLLTLLLQIFVNQLEKQEVISEMETENSPETHMQLQEMMKQIQLQSVSLESLKDEINNQKKTPERKTRVINSSAATSAPSGSSMMVLAGTPTGMTQRRIKTPSVVSQAASWEEIEEVEEIVIQQNLQSVPLTMASNRSSQVPPAPTLPLPGHLSLEEWGSSTTNFGRKHKGKTFATVMQQDPGYLSWSLARYASLMPEHQDFVRYGQLWMKEVGNDL
jgi:hypothetical protein